MSPDRRRFLGVAGSLALGGLAGCLGSQAEQQDPEETPRDVPEALELNGKTLNPIFPLKFVDTATGDIVAESHWHRGEPGHWHRQPVELPENQWRELRFEAVDLDREPIPFGENEPYQLVIKRSGSTPADRLEFIVSGDVVSLRGLTAGRGELFVEISHDGEQVFLSLPLEIEVLS